MVSINKFFIILIYGITLSLLSHRVQGMFPLADDIDVDASWPLDALLIERSDES